MRSVSEILAEEADERFPVSDIASPEVPVAEPGEDANGEEGDGPYINPNVEALVAQWRGGGKQSVALRVLDTLDSYKDFVDLLYELGEADARELGTIMDELTRNEHSPRAGEEIAGAEGEEAPVEAPGEEEEDGSMRHIGRQQGESVNEPERFDEFVEFLQEGEGPLPLKKRLKYDRLLTRLAARRSGRE